MPATADKVRGSRRLDPSDRDMAAPRQRTSSAIFRHPLFRRHGQLLQALVDHRVNPHGAPLLVDSRLPASPHLPRQSSR